MPNVTVYVISKQWADLPSKTTPIFAADMTHIEQGIKNVTDFVNTLNAEAGIYLCAVPFTLELADKLDGIEANANNYTLPTASKSTKGGVKIDGVTITIDANGVISAVGGGGGSSTISGLTDVQLNQLADGEVLKWDAESSKWVNASEIEVTTRLSALTDVVITSPSDGQYLKWDGTLNKWVNASGSGGASEISELDDVDLTNLADGEILKWDAESSKWVNSVITEGSSYITELVYDSGSDTDYAPQSTAVNTYDVDVPFTKSVYEFDQLMIAYSAINDGSYTLSGRLAFFDINLLKTDRAFCWADYYCRWFQFKLKSETAFSYFSQAANENNEGYRPRIFKIYGIKFGGGSSIEPPTYNETIDILEGE